jgi:uncharacterized protein YggE
VTGEGSAPVALTQALVSVTVEQRAPTATQALDAVRTRVQRIITVLFRAGVNVNDTQTTGISVAPQYQFLNGTQVFVGFIASYTLIVRTDVEKVGALIDAIVRAGGNINFITFSPNEADLEAGENKTLLQTLINIFF